MSHLNVLVDKLAEDLEDKPDKWFNGPKGWLYKPSFTRPQQDREATDSPDAPRRTSVGAFSGFKALVKGSVSATYKKRWFVLNVDRRFIVYYKDDLAGALENGFIDISRIIDVQISQMADAPSFCIDLVSKEKYYTLAAESQVTMVRWVYAINSCRPQQVRRSLSSDTALLRDVGSEKNQSKSGKWTRYSHTYQHKGPLMLNVMGTTNKDPKTGKILNNWIIVTSFEATSDGKPGRSEAAGVISVKDYLVAVNDVDLMKYTFNDSMEIINGEAFPKTVHFLRDNSVDCQQSRAEGWAVVFYPSLNRRRRRYVDVRWDSLNFRKPAPGGSANAQRDAFISLDKIESIKPIIDRSMPTDQQYILRLICKEGACIDHVGDDDNSLGASAVAYVDLCFAKDTQMKNWRSVLVSPAIYSSAESSTTIPVQDVEIIENSSVALTKEIASMAIKSDLTGQFAPREFSISGGSLHWTRVGQMMQVSRQRGLELANSYSCNLTSVRAVEYPMNAKNLTHRFQLILTTSEITVTVGFKDEVSLLRWLQCLRDVISLAPATATAAVYISTGIEKDNVTSASEDEEDEVVGSVRTTWGLEGSEGFQGFLYKKSSSMLSANSNAYRKRWFVLHDYILSWYKTSAEVRAGYPPQGLVDLRTAYEVRESIDPNAPENSIDIVTNVKVMTMAAIDEADFTLWLDALSDTLEVREMAIQRDGFNGGSKADKAERGLNKEERKAERIAAIRSAIVFGGALLIKTNKESMFKSAFKERYFVIASGALTYYSEQNDMFDLDKDCKGEIALANILVIESTNDSKYRSGSIFDVHARVLEGGDSNGMRIFTFDAKSADNAEKWMRELCRATEILELKKSNRGVYSSAVSEKMVQARNNRRMNVNSGVNSVVNSINQLHLAQSQQSQAQQSMSQSQSKMQTDVDDEMSSNAGSVDGSPTKPSNPDRPGEGSPSAGGRGGAGRGFAKRGGMGRGKDFRAGSSNAASAIQRNTRTDSVSVSSTQEGHGFEAEPVEPGERYSDVYGDGGI